MTFFNVTYVNVDLRSEDMGKLGELYHPSGLALETAREVLETTSPMASNVAMGCPNDCHYCYGSLAFKKKDWTNVRFPKESPSKMVMKQLDKGLKPDGAFLSFATDPLASCNMLETVKLVRRLQAHNIPVAVLSKQGVIHFPKIRHGATIVSIDRKFRKKWEPWTLKIHDRIDCLKAYNDAGYYTWISMEPLPPPAIFEQNLIDLLEAVKFVDFIIAGKWNYNKKANTAEAKVYYQKAITTFRDFCTSNKIRYHVKSDTLKFIGEEQDG